MGVKRKLKKLSFLSLKEIQLKNILKVNLYRK